MGQFFHFSHRIAAQSDYYRQTLAFIRIFQNQFPKNHSKKFASSKNGITFATAIGALAHLVERNTGSVEVSGSSPLCSTSDKTSD